MHIEILQPSFKCSEFDRAGGTCWYRYFLTPKSAEYWKGLIMVNNFLQPLYMQVVSAVAYGADEPSLKYFLMNSFKIGVMSALIVDALKLGG